MKGADASVNGGINARSFTFTGGEDTSPAHPRESGDPVILRKKSWVPAFAGTSGGSCRKLQPRNRGQRNGLAGALLLEQVGEQEREVERLIGVEARIADRTIAVVQILVGD